MTRAAAACARSISSNATASRGALPRQVAAPAAQLGQSAYLGGQCAQLAGGARRVAGQQQQQARGFRSTTTTMGLKTGIVGLPNVGKVRPGSRAGGSDCRRRQRRQSVAAPPLPTPLPSPLALQSTMFNALCENAKAQAANFPFCTIEPNVGIVAVPDSRLAQLRCSVVLG